MGLIPPNSSMKAGLCKAVIPEQAAEFSKGRVHTSCHGGAGTAINFGDADDPEFVGTIAVDNPWEFIHKVRNGQPGTRMPSAAIDQWSEKTILDLLSFAQTLPKDKSEVGLWKRFWGGKHHQGMMHRNNGLKSGFKSGRGFGPGIE